MNNFALAEGFKFETSEIEIINDGKLINAKNGKVISEDNNLEIIAKNFKYNKELDILNAYNGIAYIKSDHLELS